MAKKDKSQKVEEVEQQLEEVDELEAQMKALEKAEASLDSAYGTGKVERAKITQMAQLDAAEAVAMVGIAMEADEEADEAMRISVIAERSGDREKAKAARKKEREARKKANADHKAATKSAKQAYDAIKYSAPNQMGFMRAVQVAFAVHIGVLLIWLTLTSRDSMTYNVSTMMDWLMAILEGVAFWMFINRYKIARPFVMVMAAIGLIVPAVYDVMTGHFNPFALSLNGVFYLFLFFYFAFSDRVKATMINSFAERKGDYDKEDFVIDRHGWPFYRNLIMYFIVFSIIGHWMEMGMCQFIIMGLVQGEYDPSNTMLWRDWLYPFPMEGAAVVIIALVLYPFWLKLRKKFTGKRVIIAYIISFFAGALLCTIIEFSMGLLVNADLQLWDYRDNFCNIMGQVCLQNTMAFGVVAGIITWWVYPLLERLIARVPRDIMNIVFVVVALFGAIIWSLYIINPPGVDEQNKHPELAEQIAQEQAAKKEAEERESLAIGASIISSTSETLREEIAKSEILTAVEKEQVIAELGEITEKANSIVQTIAPDSDMAMVLNGSASAAASGASASAASASEAASGASASAASVSAAAA